jgi:hypothetical protein
LDDRSGLSVMNGNAGVKNHQLRFKADYFVAISILSDNQANAS